MEPKQCGSAIKRPAFIVEVTDEDNQAGEMDFTTPNVSPPPLEKESPCSGDTTIHLPVVIDLKPHADKGEKRSHDGCRSSYIDDEQPQVACHTVYIGPCPEIVNANFKHPDFMICYRDNNSRCENGMMRYYCCPLYLAAITKNGEESFELRAVQTDPNLPSSSYDSHWGRFSHDWHKYYQHVNLAPGMPSHHSFSQHHFNCRQVPPQFHFLHHCSCSCPSQMMAAYLNNYHCQNGGTAQQAPSTHCPPTPSGMHPSFRQFNYHSNYMFSTHGSAMG